MKLHCCPSTLAPGFDTFSPAARRALFDGKKVSHVLTVNLSGENWENANMVFEDQVDYALNENKKFISISGVQEKASLALTKNELSLTKPNQQGHYILKPVGGRLRNKQDQPANEHLTMQLAQQVYGIRTAANGLVFFENDEPAYLTRRFDVLPSGQKVHKEDCASLALMTSQTHGESYKYDYSYEALGALLKRYLPAWPVEAERYFKQVVFNYLFSNGDAHLKNFGVVQTAEGDFVLSPAYDLICTKLHLDDTFFAFSKGLFEDGYQSPARMKKGRPGKTDFTELAHRLGIRESRVTKLLEPFLIKQPKVAELVQLSYLSSKSKRAYYHHYENRLNGLLEQS